MAMPAADFFVKQGLAPQSVVADASAASAREGGDLVTNLVARTDVDEATWLAAMSDMFGHEAAPVGPLPRLTPDVVGLIPHELLVKYEVYPLGLELETLVIAAARPLAPELERALVAAAGRPIWVKLALELRIRQALTTSLRAPPWPRVDALVRKLDANGASASAGKGARPPRGPADAPAPAPPAQADALGQSVDATVDAMSRADVAEAVLRALFEFASRLFPFTALFGTSGDLADGKWVNVRGKGTREIQAVQIPLPGQSVLATAREKGAVTLVSPTNEGFDKLLFSLLGHQPKNPVIVAPVIVRSRPIALVLGDPGKAGLPPASVASLAAVATAAGHQLERIIWRRKLRQGDLPPREANAPESARSLPTARRPAGMSPPGQPPGPVPARRSSDRRPEGVAAGATGEAGVAAVEESVAAGTPQAAATAPRRRRPIVLAAVGILGVIAIGGAVAFAYSRAATRGPIEPLAVLEEARGRSGLGKDAKLGALRANVNADGHVVVDEGPSPLVFTFVSGARVVDVQLGANGLSSTENTSDVPLCGDAPCVLPALRPACSIEKLWQEALRFGATKRDVAQLSLSSERGAVWLFSVPNRGVLRINDATCTRQPRSRIKPPARALSAIPGSANDIEILSVLGLARAQAGLEDDAELNSISTTKISREGRVDLVGGDGSGTLVYVFSDPAGVTPLRRRRVTLSADGASVAADVDDPLSSQVPPPKCSVADVIRRMSNTANIMGIEYAARRQTQPAEPEWLVHVASGGYKRSWAILDRVCAEKRDAPLTPMGGIQ